MRQSAACGVCGSKPRRRNCRTLLDSNVLYQHAPRPFRMPTISGLAAFVGLTIISMFLSGVQAADDIDYACLHRASWQINDAGATSPYFTLNGAPAPYDVQSARYAPPSSGSHQFTISATDIPNYPTTITQSMATTLDTRPKESTDFTNGAYNTALDGTVVQFGQDIGYSSTACR